ncbi:helix-turn-helix transcriptional regulator [Streptomyces sp. NA04227]|uniref:helix-turn-helix domain-containing protein n=1 Tax=Streptomyces sp. NA04227 TaxID=2742136 RepID=UPI0015920292|nr:helix-turn-helix transcriptional regulator [Streptomyces sp. NA04227]QKW08879.1 helix-turn-helix transcriptional regulator [Streptomyces sp. NA04227]
MPPRRTPTQRQKRLGTELRKMRLAAGASTEFAAGLLGVDRTKVSNIESGTRTITPERIRKLACNYSCEDGSYIDALAAMASDQDKGWWEGYRGQLPVGLLDIAELEWHARKLRVGVSIHLPGLLQTDRYARTIFAAALPALEPAEIELRVALRLQRQQALHRNSPLHYVGYVHEAALRMEFGGAKVMRPQLELLCESSEMENVELRAIPFKAGVFPGAGQSVIYFEDGVPNLDTVQLDSAHGPEFSDAQAQLDKYRSHLDRMAQIALPPEQSRDFVHHIARDL